MQCLARTGGADQQNVALAEFDVVCLDLCVTDALVVVVNRHRKRALGLFLPDYVVVEKRLDLGGYGKLVAHGIARGFLGFFQDDVVTQVDAFFADDHRRPGDKLAHFMLVAALLGLCEFGGWLARADQRIMVNRLPFSGRQPTQP